MSTLRHGHWRNGKATPTWASWRGMFTRCYWRSDPYFDRYGGRGIKVCARWRRFENFLADMGERPDGTCLDRIDNNGHYTPQNCRWSTRKEQARNRSSSVVLTYKGRSQPAIAWAEELRMHRSTLSKRLRHGWSVKRALTQPVRSQK